MRKGLHILWLVILCQLSAVAQNSKGLSVSPVNESLPEGKTYALIVGISKYQNPAIPPLQFADRDAVAFRNYLVATGVDSNNIILLLNEKATNGEFWTNLNYVSDSAKKGDKVYIYFSGHGDVENKTVVKDAYLLSYDAPRCAYPGGGAIGVEQLKHWIASFSAKGVQAIFIADACHSGRLAGGAEGLEAVAATLKDTWQDEIKMLSCQPGEHSLEGRQWGGGRGLFSYELINGMLGLADKNQDGKVTLKELNLYLLETVSNEAEPLSQNPVLSGGDMNAVVSYDNPKLLASLFSRPLANNVLATIDTKGFDDDLVANLDDTIKKNYHLFNLYLDSGIVDVYHSTSALLPSAYYYYIRIPESEKTKLLRALMKKKLASACLARLDNVLSAGMAYTDTTNDIMIVSSFKIVDVIRAIYTENELKSIGYLAKVNFYYAESFDHHSDSINMLFDLVLKEDSTSAYFYAVIAGYQKERSKKISYLKKAIELSPKFHQPYADLTKAYLDSNEFDSAMLYNNLLLQQTIYEYPSKYRYGLINLSAINYKLNLQRVADSLYQECLLSLQKQFGNDTAGYNDGFKKLGDQYYDLGFFAKALPIFLSTGSDNKPWSRLKFDIAVCYAQLGQPDKAISYLSDYLHDGKKEFGGIVWEQQNVNNKYLDPIRSTPQFKSLMKKYFPDQYKE